MSSTFKKPPRVGLPENGIPRSASPATSVPRRPRVPRETHFTFSLRYWEQQDNFGLRDENISWFVGVLDRLKTISNQRIEDIFKQSGLAKSLRFHAINWSQKNIPITRDDLTQIPTEVRNNPEEFELYQFSISQSLGRIVGYFDFGHIFHIVLLDPKHNIQPTKNTGYRVDATRICHCQLSTYIEHTRRVCSEIRAQRLSDVTAIAAELEQIENAMVSKTQCYVLFPMNS